MYKFFVFIIITWSSLLFAQTPIYSFFTAGHAYGSPINTHYGLHYPFVNYINTINNYDGMELGIFTGDVVVSPTYAYWDSAQTDFNKLEIPFYIAAGNHDIGSEFVTRFGNYYYSFTKNNDLFIVLTPGLNAWNIEGNQLDFLIKTLDSNYTTVNNIFIFMHELIWWSPTNEYKNIEINYEPHYPGSTNFESVIKPLLLTYPNNFTLFAGDVGCTDQVSPYMYHKFDNITLIASGMGGEVQDNIIITEVYEDYIYYNLVSINGTDPKALGEIYDFSINIEKNTNTKLNNITVCPNPSNGIFTITNKYNINITVDLFNIYGSKVLSKYIHSDSYSTISITDLDKGIYILQYTNNNYVTEQQKIIIN